MKKGFTAVELMIVVAIFALLSAIAIPNFMRSKCLKAIESGEDCPDYCKDFLSENKVLVNKDINDIEVFCKIVGVDIYDFKRSKSLQNYYEEFKKGNLDLKKLEK